MLHTDYFFGRERETVELYRSAIAILDEARPNYDRDVFNCDIKIGDILKLQDDGDGALKEYKIASGIGGDMAGRDPEDLAWKAQSHRPLHQTQNYPLAFVGFSRPKVRSYRRDANIAVLLQRVPITPGRYAMHFGMPVTSPADSGDRCRNA